MTLTRRCLSTEWKQTVHIGYDGCTCIEIEDKAFEDSKEKVEKSLILSKRYLEKYVI